MLEMDRYFVVKPAFSGLYREIIYEYPNVVSMEVTNPYISENEKHLTQEELLEFLKRNRLLEEIKEEQPAERYWPNG